MTAYTPSAVARMCSSKNVAIARRPLARRRARDLGKRYGCAFRIYKCPVCGFYHVTKQEAAHG